jgi:competence protein ComEA
MRKIKYHLDRYFEDFFGFSRNEINGFYLLSVVIMLVLLTRLVFLYILQPVSTFQIKISQLPIESKSQNDEKGSIEISDTFIENTNEDLILLEKFDPNEVSKQQLLNMGLDSSIADRWINYLSKGGRFRKTDDLSKLYGLPPNEFERLKQYISIPSQSRNEVKKEKQNIIWEQKTTSLNEADTTDLKTVRGIGSYFARQIVEYRERLGGYIAIEQLFEIYRMDTAKVDAIAEKFRVEKNPTIRKIRINQIDSEEFIKHPYVGYTNGKIIMAYRDVHGGFKELADLSLIKQVDVEKIKKLSPYLNFDE